MAFHHADETFFIDSDETVQGRIDPRTAAKMIARNRQDIIAGELSRLAGEEYLEDIMQHMRQMEARFAHCVCVQLCEMLTLQTG
jgi:hypothetical protein